MKHRLVPSLFLLGLLVQVTPVLAASATRIAAHGITHVTGNVRRDRVIVVSRVARSARKHEPRLEIFADWLARHLRDQGIEAGAGLVARNPREMISFLRDGRVDVVSESVLTALRYEDESGAEILMHEWRGGQPYYQSVFVTARDTPIYRLEDLTGKRVAFEDRGSTTAFLLPLSIIIRAGLKPVELPGPKAPVPGGAVGYVFAGSETNISAWTASDIVDAGAYSNRDWEKKKSNPKRYRNKMRIFHVTMPLPRSVLLVRKGMMPRLKTALRKVLVSFAGSPDAVAVRERYYDVARFDPIDGKVAADIKEARAVYRSVRHVLE